MPCSSYSLLLCQSFWPLWLKRDHLSPALDTSKVDFELPSLSPCSSALSLGKAPLCLALTMGWEGAGWESPQYCNMLLVVSPQHVKKQPPLCEEQTSYCPPASDQSPYGERVLLPPPVHQ